MRIARWGGLLLTVSFAVAMAQTVTPNAGTTPQSTPVTAQFFTPLSVTVKDAGNNPVTGLEITFTAPIQTVASGIFSNSGGSITTAITNSSGVATAANYTANTHAGTYNVTAAVTSAGGYPTANFALTNAAGTATQMSVNAGTTPQSAAVTTAFGTAPAVTVQDTFNNPVPGVTVTFTAPPSGASGKFANNTNTTQAATGANGVAAAAFTANTQSGGPYNVTAAASGLTTVNFALTNTAGPPTQMTANANTSPQSAAVTTSFGTALGVTILDANNNPVSGVLVTFTAPSSGASGKFANNTTTTQATTGANGVATASALTANTLAGGPYNATASATGPAPVNFQLTNTSGPATQMTPNASTTPQSASVGAPFGTALSVTVLDANNNPKQGVVVTFTAPPQTGASGTFANSTGTTQATTDINGVAAASTFTANANFGGPYNVAATASGLTTVNFSLTNTASGATKLAITTQPPSNGITAQALSPAVVVQVQDSGGNVVTGPPVSVTIGSTPAGVGGTVTVNSVNGVATFSNLTFAATGSYTLTAISAGLTSVTSNSIAITGPPSQVVFTIPPGNGTAGQSLTPAVVAKIEDASGNVVANSTAAVTISSTPAGVGGTLTVNAVAGVATFGNLSFTLATSYTVTASSAGLASMTSASFTISAGPAGKVAFTVQPPANGAATQALSPSVVVQVQDANGNVVTGSAAPISISSTPAGLVGAPVTTNAASGAATFSGLVFNTAGSYTLTASSAGLQSATSTSVAIAPGTASKLGFPVQPANGTAGQSLTPAVLVQVQDANGNVVTGSTAAVTMSSTPSGVSGTLTVNAVNGVATFSTLSFSTPASYTLTASASGLTSVTSNSFTISAGSGNKLAITVQPPANGTAGQALSPVIVVQVQDSIGNVVTGSTAPVTISSTPAGITGTVTVNAASGVATFSNLVFNLAGSYTLTAASAGLTNATSSSVAIAPGPASKLGFSVQPPNGTSGVALTPAVVVQVQDAFGNLIAGSTAAITLNSAPSGASGTLTANAVAGVATFSNVIFPTTGSYTLTAISLGLAQATSNAFAIGGLTVTTASLNPATRSAPFSQQLSATGGTLPYTWSMPTGLLAAGVALSSSGLISGTPTVSGSFGFTVRVRDNVGATADQALTLTVANALTISTCPASNGVVGQTYASTAIVSGGTAPYTWSLTGSFPPGLALNALTGAVTGTPTSSGTFTTTLQVVDKSTAAATQSCGFTIAPALAITTLTVSDASVSSPYTQTLLATGGKGPYTWARTLGVLPQGLTLSSSGVISGTTTQEGSFSFTASVTDSTNVTVSQTYTMNVVAGLIVGGCPASLAEVGFAYNSAIVAQGGTTPYTWAVTAGTLPTGLLLNAGAGTITGTPTVTGVAQLTFTITDKASRTASKQCSIDVRAALSISTVSLSQGNTASSYSDSVAVTGGIPPLVFTTTAGSLPPGISLDSGTGQFSGQPTTAGSFQFTVAVVDNLGAQANRSLTITVAAGLNIPNCPTPVATVNQAYSGSLVAQGGTTPYVWTLATGPLPTGLTLDSPNAVIVGTPTAPGTFPFVLRVDDAASRNTTRSCSIQVNPAPLSITSAASFPNALVGVAYTQTLTATGGVAPYTWLVASGTLPASFTLDPSGLLSGTTTVAGTFNFTVQATDQSGTTARQNISLIVLAGTAPVVTITGLSDIVDPATQPTFNVQLTGTAYPAPIDGTVTLTVVPDPAVGVVDPAVQFANGGQTLKFTVAANSTTPVFGAAVPALQTGTIAGTIQLSVKLSSNGSDVTPPNTAVRSIRIDRLAPRIVSMSVVRTTNGLEVHIVGFSTTREVTQGSFQFSVSGGSPLNAGVSMSAAGTAWFGSQQSQTFGGQFSLVQPFTFQGSVGTLTSVSATLSNAQGTSPPVTSNF